MNSKKPVAVNEILQKKMKPQIENLYFYKVCVFKCMISSQVCDPMLN